jgi:hypothetical protein
MFIVVRVQWLMQLAHLTLLRFDLLEVAIDDTLERKLILALLFRDTLAVHNHHLGRGTKTRLSEVKRSR